MYFFTCEFSINFFKNLSDVRIIFLYDIGNGYGENRIDFGSNNIYSSKLNP